MVCLQGEPDQLSFLPEISRLRVGVELGSYGLVGIRSQQDWMARVVLHRAVREQFHGALAVHGPFIGMEYAHADHLIRDVVRQRLDMILAVAQELRACRVILHSGLSAQIELFRLQEKWLKENVEFWRGEIQLWAEAGIQIVLENETETSPDILLRLVRAVDHPSLGLCLDVGHQHMFSGLAATEWVRRMGSWLYHVHLHDNDRSGDHHWLPGRGTIDFAALFSALECHSPQVTISLEAVADMDALMAELRRLARQFDQDGG